MCMYVHVCVCTCVCMYMYVYVHVYVYHIRLTGNVGATKHTNCFCLIFTVFFASFFDFYALLSCCSLQF